jgi:RepB DNA-primase from phage plasmid
MHMPADIREAERMLNLFTSVGARSFVVTKLDVEQKLIWGKTYSALELRDKLPAMVSTAADRKKHKLPSGEMIMAGENLIVRPVGDVVFVQLDDLSSDQLERVRPASFLIHATSPGNFQAWIAVSDVPKTESKEFQFRYSSLDWKGSAETAYALTRRRGGQRTQEGYSRGSVLGSYVHAHWASNPLLAGSFVLECSRATG